MSAPIELLGQGTVRQPLRKPESRQVHHIEVSVIYVFVCKARAAEVAAAVVAASATRLALLRSTADNSLRLPEPFMTARPAAGRMRKYPSFLEKLKCS